MAKEDVFVVHGRDIATKDAMFTFLRSIGLRPIEWGQAVGSAGKGSPYVGEVLDAGFEGAQAVVVLLTGDDEGRVKGTEELRSRARQNVVFEFGFFVGAIGRKNVAILYHEEVERPSDIDGLLYTVLDSGEGWKMKLGREMKAAGIEIDLNAAL